ncbi:MAG: hypothetical protein J0I20_23320 [Chloroflexi bacterium]|nr:hypothetical protein [Chloroflexota bacterium]
MNHQRFRDLVRDYRRSAGFTQKALADVLGLHQQVLSRKMSNIGFAQLNHAEVKKIILTLTDWQAISNQAQVDELLNQFDLEPNFFSQEEWESYPLKRLAKSPSNAYSRLQKPQSGLTSLGEASLSNTFHFDNLPVQLTTLIGRETVVAQAGQLLTLPNTRLLSFIGPGGSGKTRLAIEVGRVYKANFFHGVCFVNLAEITDSVRVGAAIYQALGQKGQTPYLTQELKGFLRDLQLLLILDNFEQLTGANGLIEELLKFATGLKILVTTRVVLRLYGEQEFVVPTLALPGPGEELNRENADKYDAIHLFVERIRAINPDFYLADENVWVIAKICHQLNGLPLALELAAARTRLLSLTALLDRLTVQKLDLLSNGSISLPQRQKTLRNTLGWSYRLLTPEEQILFRILGIFRGSFSVEAVQAVWSEVLGDPTINEMVTMDWLEALLEESLINKVQHAEPTYGFTLSTGNLTSSSRFKMLETIREYALEQLKFQGEYVRCYLAKLNYYLELTGRLREQINGPDQNRWLNMLDLEYANIRTLIETGLSLLTDTTPGEQTEIIVAGLKLCRNLGSYWDTRGFYVEGQLTANNFLAAARQNEMTGTKEYSWTLSISGLMTGRLGDFGQAQGILDEGYHKFAALHEKSGEAYTLNFQGSFAFLVGDYTLARQKLVQAEEICYQTNDKRNLGRVLISLAILDQTLGNYTQANDQIRHSLLIYQDEGNKRMIGACLNNLAGTALLEQDYETARTYFYECLRLHTEQAEYRSIAYTLRGLATISYYQGEYSDADTKLLESLRLSYRIGDKYQIGQNLALLAILNVAKFERNLLDDISQEPNHYLEAAARLMGGSAVQFNLIQAEIEPLFKDLYLKKIQTARSRLGEAEFNNYYNKGLNLSLSMITEKS